MLESLILAIHHPTNCRPEKPYTAKPYTAKPCTARSVAQLPRSEV
ncbi:hypothetical protein K239x_18060 [Planctomycetes bacterium K23_9]|uniref:Uncharacterized protein n=1 Tax=Stieleria marina TaxID=1930275 RepID=A0A517NRS9_9BACT|nr:hypothetical protein K239x_18060 [Planctomycetes bacterium K23_9]